MCTSPFHRRFPGPAKRFSFRWLTGRFPLRLPALTEPMVRVQGFSQRKAVQRQADALHAARVGGGGAGHRSGPGRVGGPGGKVCGRRIQTE